MSQLRFLFDVGVGKLAEKTLADEGHDVLAVRDLNPAMTDRDILRLATEQRRIVVTMDTDFGELVFRQGRTSVGVLLLRTDDAIGTAKALILSAIVDEYGGQLPGRFSVYCAGRLRIRNIETLRST